MRRSVGRLFLLACLVGAITSVVFVQVASANYGGAVTITCTGATYNFTLFPSGTQDVLETVFVDGAVAAQQTFTFVGPVGGPSTLSFAVPNDGKSHSVEANAYSLTNSTPVAGLPGVATVTCGDTPPPPPPPPPTLCTYTKGYYRNHPAATAAVITGMGGKIKVGASMLTGAQAQTILNSTPGDGGPVTYSSNVLLNLVQQVITAELNLARGSTAGAPVLAGISSANAAVTVTFPSGGIKLASGLSSDALGALVATIEPFNSVNDCG